MKKLIRIDTNGDNYTGYFDQELFDIITPKIKCLIKDDGEVYEDVNWKLSLDFSGESLHCIYQGDGDDGYTSAVEFEGMIVDFDGWDFTYVSTLSELCEELAEKIKKQKR